MSASGVRRDARLRASARRKAARPDTVTARVAGALLIAATVASLLSTALLNPVFSGSDYLLKISAHQDRILAGGFFQIVAAFASAGIAVSLYPVVRRHGEALALGSVGFRLLEGGLYLVAAIGTFLLLQVGQDTTAGSPVPPYLQTSGALLQTLRDQAGLAGVLAFYLGASMYYYVFYRSRLIPRWLSGWGLAGTALGALAGLLVLFRVTGYMSAPQVVLNLPIGVNEMVLAIWLLVRGFGSPATGSAPVAPAVTRLPVGALNPAAASRDRQGAPRRPAVPDHADRGGEGHTSNRPDLPTASGARGHPVPGPRSSRRQGHRHDLMTIAAQTGQGAFAALVSIRRIWRPRTRQPLDANLSNRSRH